MTQAVDNGRAMFLITMPRYIPIVLQKQKIKHHVVVKIKKEVLTGREFRINKIRVGEKRESGGKL